MRGETVDVKAFWQTRQPRVRATHLQQLLPQVLAVDREAIRPSEEAAIDIWPPAPRKAGDVHAMEGDDDGTSPYALIPQGQSDVTVLSEVAVDDVEL
jgi:hypothetical protein